MKHQFARVVMAMATLLVPMPALAQAPTEQFGHWHHGGGWGWGHMAFGSLMMILFWGGAIFVIFLAVRWLGRGASGGTAPNTHKNAVEILQERFARGEIDKEEFEERKRLLND